MPTARSASVGWSTTADVDAVNAYLKTLRDQLAPLVAASFTDAPTLAEWAELSGRVDQQIANGSSWLYAPLEVMTGKVQAAQLEAWKPRVAAAGHPLGSAPTPPVTNAPGPSWPQLEQTIENTVWPALSRPLVILGIAWYLSRKVLP